MYSSLIKIFFRSSGSTGFENTMFIPLSIDFFTNTGSMCPVMPQIIGCKILWSYKSSLILLVASYPSIIGIYESIRIKSKLQYKYEFASISFCTIFNAVCPLIAYMHLLYESANPIDQRIIPTANLLNYSSSTIKIFFQRFIIFEILASLSLIVNSSRLSYSMIDNSSF